MNPRRLGAMVGMALCFVLVAGGLAQQNLAWTGSQWKVFPQEIKVAYLKGVLNMAAYETASEGPNRAPCISKAFTQELKSKTLGQVVKQVDQYYKDNPGKMSTPVIDVVLRACTQLCSPASSAPAKR